MSNKTKAFINFIIGLTISLLMVVIFVYLGKSKNNWLGVGTGTSYAALAGWSFLISFGAISLTYILSTVFYANSTTLGKLILPIFISILAMSLSISFSVFVFDYVIKITNKIIIEIFVILSLLITIPTLLLFVQEFNTRFMMTSISENRAQEWEYSNFMGLFIWNISVEHDKNVSYLFYKDKRTVVKFIPENIIERKFVLSGEGRESSVIDIENNLRENEKGAIVYLSNILPKIFGENERVSVIQNYKTIKFVRKNK